MARVLTTGVSRRQALGTIGAALGASIFPSLALSTPAAGEKTGPVSCISVGISPAELGPLLAEMRRSPGCLSARGLSMDDGQIAVWQEWQSGVAQSRFWSSYGLENTPNTFHKLSL